MPLFVYGSLQIPRVLERLLRRVPSQISPATLLPDTSKSIVYRRLPLRHVTYPVLIRERGTDADAYPLVDGVVINDLSSEEYAILDAFEGDQYQRDVVSVRLRHSGKTLRDVWTYVFPESSAKRHASVIVRGEEWCLDRFQREHLDAFLREECADGVHWRRT